jgi:hypothetical protein
MSTLNGATGKTGRIRTFIREKLSLRLTKFYTRLGFANRNNLAQNLRSLDLQDQSPTSFLEHMAARGILKWRFRKVADLSQVEPFMLSGRIDNSKIDAEKTEIMAKLAEGIFQVENKMLPKLINRGGSLAFYAGAGYAAYIGLTLFSSFFTSLLVTAGLYSLISGFIGNRFNPGSTPGKFFKPGRRLFPLAVAGSVLATGLAIYLYASKRLYFRYTNTTKDITTFSLDKRVYAKVCPKNRKDSCIETKLIELKGRAARRRARESAHNLRGVTDNNNIYNVPLVIDGCELKVPHRWFPAWVPYTTTTILDLCPEGLSKAELQDRFVYFFNRLWSSGIMPSGEELAGMRLDTLEAELPYRLFRDVKLKAWLDVASLYSQLGDYKKARKYVSKIINFNLTATAPRPMFYDEAIFLLTDILRAQALKYGNIRYLNKIIPLLLRNQKKLKSLERGYRVRYNYELLKTCAIAEQVFSETEWENYSACSQDKVGQYRESATFRYNLYTPTFKDNFLGVRTFIEYAKYLTALDKLEEAREELQNALALIDLIDDCYTASLGNPTRNWELYEPYMRDQDRWIGKGSKKAGLWSYALRCQITRNLRRGLKFWKPAKQFDPKLFRVFRAQAYLVMAEIEVRLAKKGQRTDHLLQAKRHLKHAFSIVRKIQSYDVFKFYTAMFEEQQAYYDVLISYAEVLYDFYSTGGKKYRKYLKRAERLAREVQRQKAGKSLDITYLRALLLLGSIEERNQRNKEAAEIYNTIIRNIKRAEKRLPKDQVLAPVYQILKTQALIRSSILREARNRGANR